MMQLDKAGLQRNPSFQCKWYSIGGMSFLVENIAKCKDNDGRMMFDCKDVISACNY